MLRVDDSSRAVQTKDNIGVSRGPVYPIAFRCAKSAAPRDREQQRVLAISERFRRVRGRVAGQTESAPGALPMVQGTWPVSQIPLCERDLRRWKQDGPPGWRAANWLPAVPQVKKNGSALSGPVAALACQTLCRRDRAASIHGRESAALPRLAPPARPGWPAARYGDFI